jgi:hypothetical protein
MGQNCKWIDSEGTFSSLSFQQLSEVFAKMLVQLDIEGRTKTKHSFNKKGRSVSVDEENIYKKQSVILTNLLVQSANVLLIHGILHLNVQHTFTNNITPNCICSQK